MNSVKQIILISIVIGFGFLSNLEALDQGHKNAEATIWKLEEHYWNCWINEDMEGYMSLLHADTKNRNKPSEGEWNFRMKKVWEIEKAGDEIFGLPFSMTVSDDGMLYVFDPKNGTNYILDEDGTFIKSFAKEGQGPGEIIGQERTHLVGDKVIIPGRNGTHFFTKEGEYIKTIKQEEIQRDPRIFIDEDNIISAPLTAVFLPEGKAEIIRRNIKTGEEVIIADFTLTQTGIAASGSQMVDIIVIGLSPLMTLGFHDGRLYWGMSDSYIINVSDLDGKKINSFSVNRKKKRISDNFKKKYFRDINLPEDMLPQIVKSYPNELTYFHRIEVNNGLIFVYVPDLDFDLGRAKIKQIDIFSLEGKYLYRAQVDFGKNLTHLFSPLNNFIIKDDHIYAACEREDNTIVILKCKAALPRFESTKVALLKD
jgi:hypothetical protein